MSDGITDMRNKEINRLKDINKKLTINMKSIREEDDRIIALKEKEIKELGDTNHELWEMNNILETSLKGYDKIVLDYPTLKKELEIIKKERDMWQSGCEENEAQYDKLKNKLEKEFEYGLPTSMKERAFICSKIYDLLKSKK